MDLFIVVNTIGGFAREDSPEVSVIGAYSDAAAAEAVRKVSGTFAKVVPVTVDAIPKGVAEAARQFGITI